MKAAGLVPEAVKVSGCHNLQSRALPRRRGHRKPFSSVRDKLRPTLASLVTDPPIWSRPTPRRSLIDQPCDVVLSSGFLAFANHSGFLQAIDDAGVQVSGIMGTSAGALTGSLYAAGLTPRQVAAELSRNAPLDLLRFCIPPVQNGCVSVISLDMVVQRLRELLPPTFEELPKEFAVGVVDSNNRHVVINSGPLPEAVAASAAIPIVFAALNIPGQASGPFKDGGAVDRTGLKMWRDLRRQQLAARGLNDQKPPPVLLHLVERSSKFSGNDDVASAGEHDLVVVRSPKSGVNFLSLGNFTGQMETARQRTNQELQRERYWS